jgi:hypothetical protein
MTKPKKTVLKITMLETEKEEILEASKDFGFPTMSQFVLAKIHESMRQDSLTLSRKVIETIARLNEFERDGQKFANLPQDARSKFAVKTKNKLLALCSDGPA